MALLMWHDFLEQTWHLARIHPLAEYLPDERSGKPLNLPTLSLATSLGFLLFLGEEEDDLCFYFVKLHIMKVRLLQVFSSVWVMMNKRTRRLSQMPEEVRGEIEPYFIEHAAILDEDSRKLPKLNDNSADYMRALTN
ncbi:uncharacterized protein LOC131220850 [Magnolia sinica]|uniref:uncharacterized protein LOC131220850 n=1 Tax=Magnolia sinica TaxID=86752 RepID=UPI0026588BA9|nr:uncharacterized protein LOC131220850 [Magnolia sinica]